MNRSKPGLPLLTLFFAIVLFTACEKKEYQSIQELDEENIQNYIRANNLKVQAFENSGIYYEILAEGTGDDIDYANKIPVVFTQRSLDGQFQAIDTFSVNNRYNDYFGYFPFGSAYAGQPGSPVEKDESIKMVIKKTLIKTGGKIRVIVPSRQMYGRNGDRTRGIPPNASIDFTVRVIDDIANYEDGNIQEYLQKNNLTGFEKTVSGIYYKISEPGTGSPITTDSTLLVDYTGRLLNGSTFDSNTDASFLLSDYIKSWLEIFPMVKEGAKVRFITPSSQAYGINGRRDTNTGAYVIPVFSPLDFDVTVKEVKQ